MPPRKPAQDAQSPTGDDQQQTPPETPNEAQPPAGDEQQPNPPADDIPVFAPAEEAPIEEDRVYDIPGWLADNYDELIADPNRNDSYTKLAERSTEAGHHELAGWARQRARQHGEDITPVDATPTQGSSTRGDGDQ